MQISMQDAYVAACQALGEFVVRERLLSAELARRDHEAAIAAAEDLPTPEA